MKNWPWLLVGVLVVMLGAAGVMHYTTDNVVDPQLRTAEAGEFVGLPTYNGTDQLIRLYVVNEDQGYSVVQVPRDTPNATPPIIAAVRTGEDRIEFRTWTPPASPVTPSAGREAILAKQ